MRNRKGRVYPKTGNRPASLEGESFDVGEVCTAVWKSPLFSNVPSPIPTDVRSSQEIGEASKTAMDGRPITFLPTLSDHPMRLFIASFCLTGAITASISFAGNDEPLTGGTGSPGHARFEVSPAQEYLVARARTERMHRDAIIRQRDWMGFDFGRPNINSDVFNNAQPVVRMRRIYSYPVYWIDSRSSGF